MLGDPDPALTDDTLPTPEDAFLRASGRETGNDLLVEDCSSRSPSPSGCQRCSGAWVGDNLLGTFWMELREELRALP